MPLNENADPKRITQKSSKMPAGASFDLALQNSDGSAVSGLKELSKEKLGQKVQDITQGQLLTAGTTASAHMRDADSTNDHYGRIDTVKMDAMKKFKNPANEYVLESLIRSSNGKTIYGLSAEDSNSLLAKVDGAPSFVDATGKLAWMMRWSRLDDEDAPIRKLMSHAANAGVDQASKSKGRDVWQADRWKTLDRTIKNYPKGYFAPPLIPEDSSSESAVVDTVHAEPDPEAKAKDTESVLDSGSDNKVDTEQAVHLTFSITHKDQREEVTGADALLDRSKVIIDKLGTDISGTTLYIRNDTANPPIEDYRNGFVDHRDFKLSAKDFPWNIKTHETSEGGEEEWYRSYWDQSSFEGVLRSLATESKDDKSGRKVDWMRITRRPVEVELTALPSSAPAKAELISQERPVAAETTQKEHALEQKRTSAKDEIVRDTPVSCIRILERDNTTSNQALYSITVQNDQARMTDCYSGLTKEAMQEKMKDLTRNDIYLESHRILTVHLLPSDPRAIWPNADIGEMGIGKASELGLHSKKLLVECLAPSTSTASTKKGSLKYWYCGRTRAQLRTTLSSAPDTWPTTNDKGEDVWYVRVSSIGDPNSPLKKIAQSAGYDTISGNKTWNKQGSSQEKIERGLDPLKKAIQGAGEKYFLPFGRYPTMSEELSRPGVIDENEFEAMLRDLDARDSENVYGNVSEPKGTVRSGQEDTEIDPGEGGGTEWPTKTNADSAGQDHTFNSSSAHFGALDSIPTANPGSRPHAQMHREPGSHRDYDPTTNIQSHEGSKFALSPLEAHRKAVEEAASYIHPTGYSQTILVYPTSFRRRSLEYDDSRRGEDMYE